MRGLGVAVRTLFSISALIGVVAGGSVALTMMRSGVWGTMSSHGYVRTLVVTTYFLATPLLTALAVWMMTRGGEYTRPFCITISAMNLPLFPIGTIAAICGLIYFNKTRVPAPMGHVPVEGDGTTRWSQGLFVAAQFAVFWLLYGVMIRVAVSRGLPHTHGGMLTTLVGLGLMIHLSVLIHELGHFAAGWAERFQLRAFRVGVFDWAYMGGRWRFTLRAGGVLGGGATAMVPEHAERLRERCIVLSLGGPIGSLLGGLTAWAAVLAIAGPQCPPVLGAWMVFLAASMVSDFILNLYPAASGVSYSDGARILQLLRRGPWAEHLCATHYMGLSFTTELRPRDWPGGMVERSTAFAQQIPGEQGSAALAYVHYEDRGEVEKADVFLKKACEVAREKEGVSTFTMERGYFDALYRGDPAAGLRWLSSAEEKPDSADYWRTKAVVLAAAGDREAARAAWNRGWALVSKLPVTGVYEMDRRQFRDIERMLEERYETVSD